MKFSFQELVFDLYKDEKTEKIFIPHFFKVRNFFLAFQKRCEYPSLFHVAPKLSNERKTFREWQQKEVENVENKIKKI